MDLTTFKHFLQMGNYAAYVWPAYIITFVVLMINVIVPIIRKRKLRRIILRNNKSYK